MAAPKPKEPKQTSSIDFATFDAAMTSSITDEPLLTAFIRACNMQGISQEEQATRKAMITTNSRKLAKMTRPERRVQLFRLMLGISEQ